LECSLEGGGEGVKLTTTGKKVGKHHNPSLPQNCVTFDGGGALQGRTDLIFTSV
jgi:hypothetical protein